MLDPQFKSEWVAALRSGVYQQTRNTLRLMLNGEPPKYYCLGVACELKRKKIKQNVWDKLEYAGSCNYTTPANFLKIPVLASIRYSLLNDIDRKTFAQIADIIEKDTTL